MTSICKSSIHVFLITAQWLPWIQTGWRDGSYDVVETNCIKQPTRQLPSSSYNHNTLITFRTSVRNSPASIKNVQVPYCNFEVHL